MKDFVEYLAKNLVDFPDSVQVSIKTDEERKTIFSLQVKKEDLGKVIGKEGKNAQAMRTLLTAVGAKAGKRAILDIIDDHPVYH
jgi:predicted RNA-binding protein YlqC (UPF0109 family)